jgi:hypothetical protein
MTMPPLLRLLAAALLGISAALLVSCGGSDKGLIPEANAGPLRGDFEAVAQAAQAGNGSCAGTERALAKTERDLQGLPASIDAGLRSRLQQGVSNLHRRALEMCAEPAPTATTTTSAPTTSTETTPAQTATTTTNTATTPVTPPSNEGGGTAAPREEEGEGHGVGKDKGKGVGKDGGEGRESGDGASSGGASSGGGQ